MQQQKPNAVKVSLSKIQWPKNCSSFLTCPNWKSRIITWSRTVIIMVWAVLDLSAIVKSKMELRLELWGIFGPHILDYICNFLSAFCFNRRLLKIRRFCSENGKTTWKVMHILEQLPVRAPSLIKHFKLNSLSVE